jgi:heme exporter protein A
MMNADSSNSLIKVDKLVKTFGLRPVLRDVSFDVAEGAVLGLLGANGSGKTTLLRILSGLSKPTAGQIMVGGWKLPDEVDAVRAQFGVVAHLPLLYDDLTAEENLSFFARLYNLQDQKQRIAEVLDRVGLKKRASELVRTFSRGMQQRLAIGRALLHNPAILLLDEPYTGLDVSGAAMLDSLIAEWQSVRRTTIMSLHDLDRAATHTTQLVILSRGKVALNASTDSIQNLPNTFAQIESEIAKT